MTLEISSNSVILWIALWGQEAIYVKCQLVLNTNSAFKVNDNSELQISSTIFIFSSGVGRTMESKLLALGIKTCGDLQCLTMSKLQQEFGPKTGQMLFRFCRGLDDRPVQREKERKSVSAEINYGIRFTQVKTKKWNILLELLVLNNLKLQ